MKSFSPVNSLTVIIFSVSAALYQYRSQTLPGPVASANPQEKRDRGLQKGPVSMDARIAWLCFCTLPLLFVSVGGCSYPLVIFWALGSPSVTGKPSAQLALRPTEQGLALYCLVLHSYDCMSVVSPSNKF